MNKLQQFCASAILTFVLTLSAFAGDISMPGATSTPPIPLRSSVSGEICLEGASAEGDVSTVVALDPITELTLGVLQSLLPLF